MTYRGGTHRLPLGHREYTRHDPRTGKTIIVQAKGVVPTKRPTAARKDVYNDLAGIALKDPKRAQGIVNNFTDIFKKDYLHAFKFRNLSVEDEKAISNMVDDRFRNPYIKLISTAEMVGRNKKSTKDYEKVIQYTRNLIDKNIKLLNF